MGELQEMREAVASYIGEGVHTGLRKWADSPQSHNAWIAIRDMPPEEWSNIVNIVAGLLLGLEEGFKALETDTCCLAVVRKEGKLPELLRKQGPHKEFAERDLKRRLSKASYVQEVRNADKDK